MGKHTNIWSPDTCNCIIEFEFDDAVPADQRVHTGKRIIKACPLHPAGDFDNCHDHYTHVLEQNNRRMHILRELVDAHPELTETLENGAKVLHRDIDYPFKYTGRGKNVTLEVGLEGPQVQKKHIDKIKEVANRVIGPGKVIVK